MGNICLPALPPKVDKKYVEMHFAFALQYNTTTDAMDSEKFATELFNPDATFMLGNFPTSVGKDMIKAGAENIYNAVKELKHTTESVTSLSESKWSTYLSAFVTFLLIISVV